MNARNIWRGWNRARSYIDGKCPPASLVAAVGELNSAAELTITKSLAGWLHRKPQLEIVQIVEIGTSIRRIRGAIRQP